MKSTINYKKPINGLQRIFVSSFAREFNPAKTVLVVPFVIQSLDRNVTFSDGEIEFAFIDLKARKMTPAPEWIFDLLYRRQK